MKKLKMTAREYILVVILLLLLIGICYYEFYYSPLQTRLQSLSTQSGELDSETSVAAARLGTMSKMQKELDEIFARPQNEITEIAPYDNAKVVMNELNGILSQSQNYKLTFSDPVIEAGGIVRRTVSMNFSCTSYYSALQVINNLNTGHWRCLMRSLSVSGDENIATDTVSCAATIVFFESTKLE